MKAIHGSKRKYDGLIRIQLSFALITSHRAAKNSVAAIGTYIAGLFVLNPFFSAELPSIRNSSEYNLLADCHREIVNVVTGKFIAFMTPGVPFFFCTVPDLTMATMHKSFIG
jgi:hypothetical protein